MNGFCVFVVRTSVLLLLGVGFAAFAEAASQADAVEPPAWSSQDHQPGEALWPWSVPAASLPDRRAFLWVPPHTKHLRGLVVAVHNMLEKPLFERAAFREECAKSDVGLLMVFSGHDSAGDDNKNPQHPNRSALDIFLNPNFPKGEPHPAQAGQDLQNLLDVLADESGYAELKTVPLMPVGHSSAGDFVWHIARWDPSRFFAVMPFKTGNKTDGVPGIPTLFVNSEWFDYGNATGDVGSIKQVNAQTVPRAGGAVLFGYALDVGAGHCDVTDDSTVVMGKFIRGALAARVPADSPAGQPVKLKDVPAESGWLIDPMTFAKPGCRAVPYAQYKGDPTKAFWYVNQEVAEYVAEHASQESAKKPQQINFVAPDGSVPTVGGTFVLTPKFIDDLGTFKVEARYIDTMARTDLFPPDTKLGNSGGAIGYRVNSGALTQIGPDTFRVLPHGGNLVPQGQPWEPTIVAYTNATDSYQATERPAHVSVGILNTVGADQQIDFPPIADVKAGDGSSVALKATASSGLAVQYIVVSGPAEVGSDGTSLKLLPIADRATYPVRVLVSAFQWGRPTGDKLKSAGPVMREFFIYKDAAQQTRPPQTRPAATPLADVVEAPLTAPVTAAGALVLTTLPAKNEPTLITRGDLVADFRPDAAPSANAWANHAASGASIGALTPVAGGKLTIAAVDGPAGRIAAIRFGKGGSPTLISEKPLPVSTGGAGTASVEAWVFTDKLRGDATVAACGIRDQGRQRQFLYGSNKPFSGFFNDIGDWGVYVPTAGAWHHLVWVYDGHALLVYADGKLAVKKNLNLDTRVTPLAVGAGNNEDDHTLWDNDPFSGLVAAVRVMTGVLSANDVAVNFAAGMGEVPDAKNGGAPIAGRAALGAPNLTGQAPRPEQPLTLWYRKPAKRFEEALPIGNGRLGAMVYGGVAQERLSLNEDTLWSGSPYDPVNPDAKAALPEVRRLIFAGDFGGAQNLINAKVMGKPAGQMMYQTVGNLLLDVPGEGDATDYRRDLDLTSATARVQYTRGGVRYTRETFATAVDHVIAVRLTADRPGKINFAASLMSPMPDAVSVSAGNTLTLVGHGSDKDGIPGHVRFEARVRVLPAGGKLTAADGHVGLTDADSAVLLVAMATSYKNFADVSGDPAALNSATLAAADGKTFDVLHAAHLADYAALFDRVKLNLSVGPDANPGAALPTDERIFAATQTEDLGYESLYFQFGRYLLISCSRPGGQAANLQGLWNESLTPPWGSKYTINVNTEMNYWPSETTNLPELNEPLFRMIEDLAITGAKTAHDMYGAGGWMAHHNTDLFRATAPIDGAFYGMWPTGGAWLCEHLWEHYAFDPDPKFLERAYPLMKGASQFFLDTLVEDPQTHWLMTCPTMSPEHAHRPNLTAAAGTTMDSQIVRDLFTHTAAAAGLLGRDADFAAKVKIACDRLPPNQMGAQGQLQEWKDDWDAHADDLQHRHISHLYGLFPSSQIDPRTTPQLADAAKVTLNARGDVTTGWAIAWRINCWARLGDGDRTHEILKLLLDPSRTYPNLFDAHPPFQIDGNLGGASGMVEMLLQSQNGEIHLLPALPTAWKTGSASGLRARGGVTVDLKWADGQLAGATLRSERGANVTVRYGTASVTVEVPPKSEVALNHHLAVPREQP